MKSIALIAIAVVAASASSAPAGTKYATNLVSNSAFDPACAADPVAEGPDQAPSDKGSISIQLASVVATTRRRHAARPGWLQATAGTLGHDVDHLTTPRTRIPALDGTGVRGHHVKLVLPAISGLIPVVEVPLPVDLKAGKGKTKLSAAALFALILGWLGSDRRDHRHRGLGSAHRRESARGARLSSAARFR